MAFLLFLRKHIDAAIRITAAVLLCALTMAYMFMFRGDKLPHASDGDAFDTVYALNGEKSEKPEF